MVTAQAAVAVTKSSTLSVYPVGVTLNPGELKIFKATIVGTVNPAITWWTDGGTITNSGVYTAPMLPGTYLVSATSQADPSKTASATVCVAPSCLTISAPPLILTSATKAEASVPVETGATYAWEISGGTLTSASNENHIAFLPGPIGTLVVTCVVTDATGSTKQARIVLPVVEGMGDVTGVFRTPSVSIPYGAELVLFQYGDTVTGYYLGAYFPFESYVIPQNAGQQKVLPPVPLLVEAPGTASSAGGVFGENNLVHFDGRRVSDSIEGTWTSLNGKKGAFRYLISRDALGNRTLTDGTYQGNIWTRQDQPLGVDVQPVMLAMKTGATQRFTALVTDPSRSSVDWEVSGALGESVSGDGLYTAPSAPGTYIVTARSQSDPSRSASATVVVTPTGVPSLAGAESSWGTLVFQSGSEVSLNWTNADGQGLKLLHGFFCGLELTGTITDWWGGERPFSYTFSPYGGGYGHRANENFSFRIGTPVLVRYREINANFDHLPFFSFTSTYALNTVPERSKPLTVPWRIGLGANWEAAEGTSMSSTGGPVLPVPGNCGLYSFPTMPGLYAWTVGSTFDPSWQSSIAVVASTFDQDIDHRGVWHTDEGELTIWRDSDYGVHGTWSSIFHGETLVIDGFTPTIDTGGSLHTAIQGTWSSGHGKGSLNLNFDQAITQFTGAWTDLSGLSHAWSGTKAKGSVGIRLVTSSVLMNGGKSRILKAEVTGSNERRAVWSATGGTITQEGLYTAPTTPGRYTITAASKADPSKQDSLDITVIEGPALALGRTYIASTSDGWGPGASYVFFQQGTQILGVIHGGCHSDVSYFQGELNGYELLGQAIGMTRGSDISGILMLMFAPDGSSFKVQPLDWSSVQSFVIAPDEDPSLLIHPYSMELTTGGSGKFKVLTSGITNPQLLATGGTFAADGTYTAPAQPGIYDVFVYDKNYVGTDALGDVHTGSLFQAENASTARVSVYGSEPLAVSGIYHWTGGWPLGATGDEWVMTQAGDAVQGTLKNHWFTTDAECIRFNGTLDGHVLKGVWSVSNDPRKGGVITLRFLPKGNGFEGLLAWPGSPLGLDVAGVKDWAMSISPDRVSLNPGQAVSLSVSGTGFDPNGVTWASPGASIASGNQPGVALFMAPQKPGKYLVRASNREGWAADATMTIRDPSVNVSISPASVQMSTGEYLRFTATVVGGVTQNVIWAVDGNPIAIWQDGLFEARAPGTFLITATSSENDTRLGMARVTVTREPIVVRVSPSTLRFGAGIGGTYPFAATVTGASNPALVWTSSQGSSITPDGVFSIPMAEGTYMVVATSVMNPTKQDHAFITVEYPPVAIRVTPTVVGVMVGQSTKFAVVLEGAPTDRVNWTASAGTIATDGTYTAPLTPGDQVVTVTSVDNPTRSADARVFVGSREGLAVSGIWSSPGLPGLRFFQNENVVMGEWQGQPGGYLVGRMTGRVLRGICKNLPFNGGNAGEGEGGGPGYVVGAFELIFSVDGSSFEGTHWSNPEGTAWGEPWSGTRNPGEAVLKVSPTASVMSSNATQKLFAQIGGTQSPAVTWTATGGSVSADGIYSAPAQPGSYTITAIVQADSTQSDSIVITVLPTMLTDLSGAFETRLGTLNLFQDGSKVLGEWPSGGTLAGTLSGQELVGTYQTWEGVSGSFNWIFAMDGGSFQGKGWTTPDQSGMAIDWEGNRSPGAVVIAASPQNLALAPGATRAFQAWVGGTTNKAVTWCVPIGMGAISADGVYTAPAEAGDFPLMAVSKADPSQSVVVNVSVTDTGRGLTIVPTRVTLNPNGIQSFTAQVLNGDPAIAWTATGGVITQDGAYMAPTLPGTYFVMATGTSDAAQVATATVVVMGSGSEGGGSGIVSSTPVITAFSAAPTSLAIGEWTSLSWSVFGPPVSTLLEISQDGAMPINPAGLDPTRTVVNGITSIDVNPKPRQGSTQVNYTLTATNLLSQAAAIQSLQVTLNGPAVNMAITPAKVTVLTGSSLAFSFTEVAPSTGVTWAASGGSIAPDGTFTAPLAPGVFTVTVRSLNDPTISATAAVTVVYPSVSLTVAPVPNLAPGQSLQVEFQCSSGDVNWRATGGSFAGGVYTAPTTVGTYTITATSRINPTVSASIQVLVLSAQYLITITPVRLTMPMGSSMKFGYTLTAPTNRVTWSATGGSMASDGTYTAPMIPGIYLVTVTGVDDPASSASATVTVYQDPTVPVSVEISPRALNLFSGGTHIFGSTVTALSGNSLAVTWTASGGTIVSLDENRGYFTAPDIGGTYTITATSVADPSKSASCMVDVKAVDVTLAISPLTVELGPGESFMFGSSIQNTGSYDLSLTWSAEAGTIISYPDGGALYKSPLEAGSYQIVAISNANPKVFATAAATVKMGKPFVSITPAEVRVPIGGNQVFTVDGTALSGAVQWSIAETDGGTIGSDGSYTAPARRGTFNVLAKGTTLAGATVFAAARVYVGSLVIHAPNQLMLYPGDSYAFTASQMAGSDSPLTWSIDEGTAGGRITALGAYTAPLQAGIYHVRVSNVGGESAVQEVMVVLIDAIVLSPKVEILEEGDYILSLSLQASNGKRTTRKSSLHFTVGMQEPELTFSADILKSELGVDGPYRVVDVRIDKTETDDVVPAGNPKDLGATAAYRIDRFQRPWITIGGEVTALAEDLNGNGLADQLRVSFGANLVSLGSYEWGAALVDSAGRVISHAYAGPMSLPAGANTLQLVFDGKAIHAHGKDGPYFLRDVMVRGPVLDGSGDWSGTITGFTASQFEAPTVPLAAIGIQRSKAKTAAPQPQQVPMKKSPKKGVKS